MDPAPFGDAPVRAELLVEVAEDETFKRVLATASAPVLAESDWACRVLVAELQPAREYWYRFIDATGAGSRVGRTLTAPTDDDPRPVRFAFISCQNICEGAQNAWRRMICEDRRAVPEARLGFVLHLGDFVYEVVEYPEDNPSGKRYDRRVRYPVRYPHGIRVLGSLHAFDGNSHTASTVTARVTANLDGNCGKCCAPCGKCRQQKTA